MNDTKKKKTPAELRSARWFAPDDLRAFGIARAHADGPGARGLGGQSR